MELRGLNEASFRCTRISLKTRRCDWMRRGSGNELALPHGVGAVTELAGLSELRFYDLTRSGAVSGGSDSVAVGSRMTVAHSKSDIYPSVLSRWLLLTF